MKGHGNRSRQNVTFQCNAGFKLQGNSRLTCRDGNWSHDFPRCKQGWIFKLKRENEIKTQSKFKLVNTS